MSTRVTDPLSSYDVIAKSIPGVVFLLLGASLLPAGTSLVSIGETLADYALVILVALLVGLFVGEGVHTFAELTEQSTLFVARRIENVRKRVAVEVRKQQNEYNLGDGEPVVDVETNWDKLPGALLTAGLYTQRFASFLVSEVILSFLSIVYNWFNKRYWGLHDTLKGHRLLFAHSLIWNFSNERRIGDRWQNRAKGHPYECFRECVLEEFQEELLKDDGGVDHLENLGPVEQYKSLYTVISSEVSSSDVGLSSRFQAIYSFCRSMYVVFGLVAVAYAIILYRPFSPNQAGPLYEPLWVYELGPQWHPVFVLVPLSLSVVFMIATGKYKRTYVDYLISDFCTLKRKQLPDESQYDSD